MPDGQSRGVSATDSDGDISPFVDRVDYPYFVLTVRAPDEEMSGCLAGFVTQCSIEPPNFIACISRLNHTLGVALRASAMGLHLLGQDQVSMARVFGEETGDVVDKFAQVEWRLGTSGAPVLTDVAVAVEGTILGHFAVGDHEAFLVRAIGAVTGPGQGLLTHHTSPPLQPGHPAP